MNKITGLEILNQVDDKNYKIYVEMYDTSFKIILFRPTMEPLSGEMNTEDINYFSSELSIVFNEYLEQTQKIFCGQDKTVYFFIKDYTFEWKKNVWTLGKIELYPITDINFVWKSFQKLLQISQSTQDKAITLEEENKNLTKNNKELTSQVERMTELKDFMERDLYTKFTCLLNSKKKRIKELENSMKKMQDEYKIYNVTTDESDESEKEDQGVENNSKNSIKTNKRKSLDSNSSECLQKAKKINNAVSNYEICKPSTSKDYESSIPSTSKDCESSIPSTSKGYESSITVEEKMNKEESCSSEHRNLNSKLNSNKINDAVSNNETICKPSTSKDYESSITVEEKMKKEESCSSEHRNLNSKLNRFEESPEEDLFSQ